MSSVKTYHIRGEYKRRKEKIVFGKYVRALTQEDALEQIYNTLGSKHKVKRNMIFIDPKNIKEITNPDDIKDPVIKAFATEDDLAIPKKEVKKLSEDSSPKQVSQEELNNLLMAAQQLEQQATRYNQQIEILNGYFNEIHSAEQTLKDLENAEEGNKILVPIGAGNFVYASIENGENVIVTIGAGVHSEKSLQDAVEGIKKKKTDIENQLTQIKASYNEVIERLREIDRVVKSVT